MKSKLLAMASYKKALTRGNIDRFKQRKARHFNAKQQFLKFLVSMFHNVKNIRALFNITNYCLSQAIVVKKHGIQRCIQCALNTGGLISCCVSIVCFLSPSTCDIYH